MHSNYSILTKQLKYLGSGEIPPSELPYQEDEQPQSLHQKSKWKCYRTIGKSKVLRKITGQVQYKRAHRCQSTRSRLRSLNENRRANFSEKAILNKRVHRISEMSVIEDEINRLASLKKLAPERTISMETTRSSKKEVQFDFSMKSFDEDNERAFVI